MRYTQKELDSEKWLKVNGETNMYVSNLGRVKRTYKHTERFLKPYYRKGKPPYFIKVNHKEIKLSVLVWKTFNGDYDSKVLCVAHKLLVTDDRLINLYLTTKKELGKATGGKTRKVKGVYKVDRKKRIIYDYFRTTREAARKLYCSYTTISNACNGVYKSNCTGYELVWANTVDNYVPKGPNDRPWLWFYELEKE